MSEPLSVWNDTSTRQAIRDYLAAVLTNAVAAITSILHLLLDPSMAERRGQLS